MSNQPVRGLIAHAAISAITISALGHEAAYATDLSVGQVDIIQAVQYGSTRLVGDNVTLVRVSIDINGETGLVAGVDGLLQVFVDGQLWPDAPVYSTNGPIAAPASPDVLNFDDTLNFLVLVPPSGDVDFLVQLNPSQIISETDYANNDLTVSDLVFECRAVVDLAYVPIDYSPVGAELGVPQESLIQPGVGDGFVRAIYSAGEWNYHRSPLPPLLWTTPFSTSGSANQLLNELRDIRINQIPSAGYPQPPFVFGWLPGNPYSGNGKAIGIPGDVAFGNSQVTRFQRTFAHELGHLIGRQHKSSSINTVGVDVEHHLWDTQGLSNIFPTDKKDVMVAGLYTNQAFVNATTYDKFLDDDRTQCKPAVAGGLGGPAAMDGPVLHVSGIIEIATGVVQLNPVTTIDQGQISASDPQGTIAITAIDEAGQLLSSTLYGVHSATEMCSEAPQGGKAIHDSYSQFSLVIPETIAGRQVHQIQVQDTLTGAVLADRARSANVPQVRFTSIASIDQGIELITPDGIGAPAATLQGQLNVQWAATDADGDSLSATLLYSPDGEAWLPLAVNRASSSFSFSTGQVPASQGHAGKLRIMVTDGLNQTESIVQEIALGSGSPPEVYLISPNDESIHLQHAPIAFHAYGWDLEDQMLADGQLQWTSSIDGPLASTSGAGLGGRLFIASHLSPGEHTITVTTTDSDFMTDSKEISITVLQRDLPVEIGPSDLNGDGFVNGYDLGILLGNWSIPAVAPGCEGVQPCTADLNGDGFVNGVDLGILLGNWTIL